MVDVEAVRILAHRCLRRGDSIAGVARVSPSTTPEPFVEPPEMFTVPLSATFTLPSMTAPLPFAELPEMSAAPLPEMLIEPLSPSITPEPLVELPLMLIVPLSATFTSPLITAPLPFVELPLTSAAPLPLS
jgi:hypothetical protein